MYISETVENTKLFSVFGNKYEIVTLIAKHVAFFIMKANKKKPNK